MSSRRFVWPFCTAIIYLGLGDKERALDGLEDAYEVRSRWLPNFSRLVRSSTRFVPIHSFSSC
jgi:hypothetical protein